MRFGKREQIVVLFIGTALLIFLVHLLIFQPRATEYARVKKEFEDGVATLRDTEQPQSPKQVEDFNAKTAKYEQEVTSLVTQLRLTIPKHYARLGTESVQLRMKDTLDAMRELVEMRKRLKTPQLTFLDDRKDPYGVQQGWNIPAELSERTLGVRGALWDIVSQLIQRWDTMSLVKSPLDKLRHRFYYNQQLPLIGLPPQEVCDWVAGVPGLGWVFFNDRDLKNQLKSALGFTQGQVDVRPNPYSINRFGPLLPVFKRLWVAELVWAKRDPNTQITKEQLFEALEVYPKYYPTDHGIVVANKELQALVDIVKLAEKHQILEISRVTCLKFTPVEKAVRRVPGATPTPAASPTPAAQAAQPGIIGFDAALAEPGMMGMVGRPGGMMPGMAPAVATPKEDTAVGTGAGLELEMRAYNANLVKFLFELTHGPRTYAVDDLYIYSDPKGELRTSMTVELVTDLKALKD
ncbi:MAG: hypothetical protein ACPL7D_06980 [Candidatus Sumerlaeaceae bacterium]|jgi:hypothetical protein